MSTSITLWWPWKAPFSDAQLAVAPPETPLRSKSPDAEVHNPAHTLDLTPEVLQPVPEVDASMTHQEQQRFPAHLPRCQTSQSQGAGEVQHWTMLPCPHSEASRKTGSLKALTVPVTDKAEECVERQS